MKIIEKIRFLWKAWRRTLSIDEFSSLLEQSEVTFPRSASLDNKTAKWLLEIYFKHPLHEEEMKLLVRARFHTAQVYWLEEAKRRKMSDIEYKYLVRSMPWNITRDFPSKLPDDCIYELFEQKNPSKIGTYCSQFPLSEPLEQKLIEYVQKSLNQEDKQMQYQMLPGLKKVNGWKQALLNYLGRYSSGGATSKNIQQQLLDLNDNEITKKLILRCNIIDNILHEDIIRELIDKNETDALRLLLKNSFLPEGIISYFKEKIPELDKQIDIAQIRRKIYELEQKNKRFHGAQTFTYDEEFLVDKYKNYQLEDPNNMDEFISLYIKPNIRRFGACMCAYIAYHLPNMAGELLEHIKKTYTLYNTPQKLVEELKKTLL